MKRTIFIPALWVAAGSVAVCVAPAHAFGRKKAPSHPPVAPAPAPAPAPPPIAAMSDQIYRDSQGAMHSWSIDESHVLHWDGHPYMPVGGAFQPRYWVQQTDDNWAADVAALQTLRQNHVTDMYLSAGVVGLTHVPAPAVQRMLDYLDANGFHYGIEIDDCHSWPLKGVVVKPTLYREVGPAPVVRFGHLSGLSSAFYGLAATDAEDPIFGTAKVDGDTAVVSAAGAGPEDVLLLYPERSFQDGTPESDFPDLWQGFDDYRDRLLGFFSQIKLGPGFRFFLDPIVKNLGFSGDVADIIPTSVGYRISFQAWLVKQYDHNVDDLNQSWGVKERDLPDFETAARCIPLWNGAKGLHFLYDPVTAHSYDILNTPRMLGREWDDIAKFRRDSVRGYMNTIASVLKKSVANVPVVYRCPRDTAIYVNDQVDGGFDGLGIEAFGHGMALSTAASSAGYADMQQWTRPGWLIVSDTLDTEDVTAKTNNGYDSRAVLFNDWDDLQNVGARGFFTTALQRLPDDKYARANLAAMPDQLSWMGSYAATLQASSTLDTGNGPTLPYPASLVGLGLHARKLQSGVWWIPTHRPGSAVAMGPTLRCYSYTEADGGLPSFVIWSTGGNQLAHLPFGKGANPIITDAAGHVLDIKDKKGVWPVPLGSDPVVIRRIKQIPMPLELTDEARKQAESLIKMAENQGVPTDSYKTRLFYATNKLDDSADTSGLRLTLITALVNNMMHDLQPYTFIQGETPDTHTFDSIATDPAAMGGAYLSLDTDDSPPLTSSGIGHGYQALYKFKIVTPGRYALWMAGSILNTDQVSPFSFRVDGGAYQEVRGVPPDGTPYGGKFAWSDLGNMTLKPGNHTLEIMVAETRRADKRYELAIDAFCLTRGGFKPDGLNAPTLDAAAAQ